MRLLLEAGIVFVVYFGTLLFVMGQKDFFLDLLRGIRNESPAETKQLEGVSYSSLTQQ
jgi:hypothetical protein